MQETWTVKMFILVSWETTAIQNPLNNLSFPHFQLQQQKISTFPLSLQKRKIWVFLNGFNCCSYFSPIASAHRCYIYPLHLLCVSINSWSHQAIYSIPAWNKCLETTTVTSIMNNMLHWNIQHYSFYTYQFYRSVLWFSIHYVHHVCYSFVNTNTNFYH